MEVTFNPDPHEAALTKCPSCGFRPSNDHIGTDGARNPAWVRASEKFERTTVDHNADHPWAPRIVRAAILVGCNLGDHGRDATGAGVTLWAAHWKRVPTFQAKA